MTRLEELRAKEVEARRFFVLSRRQMQALEAWKAQAKAFDAAAKAAEEFGATTAKALSAAKAWEKAAFYALSAYETWDAERVEREKAND